MRVAARSGPPARLPERRHRTAYQLHLLFDKHFDQQSELVDAIAERIQLLGGVSLAMAPDDELQVWFIAEHVVDMPLVHAEPSRQVGR